MRKRKKINFHHTYSFKLFLTFSTVMLAALLIITSIIYSEVSNRLIDQEFKLNRLVVTKTAEYVDEKVASARKTIQDIYYSDKEMQEIINHILNKDWSGDDLSRYITRKDRFDKLFMSALYNDKDIVDIILLSKDKKSSYVFSKKWSSVTEEHVDLAYPWVGEVMKAQKALTIIPSYKPTYSRQDNSIFVYSAITSIYGTNNSTGSIGAIIINFSAEMVENAYNIYKEDAKGEIMVFLNNGGVIYDSSRKYYGRVYPDFDSIAHTSGSQLEDKENIITIARSNSMDMLVCSIIPKKNLLENINKLRFKVNIFLAITILLILIIFYNASRLLSRRIHTIEEAMEKVQEGDLQARIPVGKAKDELGVIAEQFNNMCIKLNDYIKRSFLSEIKLKETELMALQAQINPHFIYNTLEIIRVKAVLQKNHDVGGMILLLSNLFRRSLRCNDVVVSIKDEIDYCKDYLELNGIRFHERMKIEYDIDRSIIEFGVLKLILQPLVENIIVHSVDDNSKLIRIIIKAYRKADDVYIEVIDSGKGIDEGKLQDINEKLDGRQENIGNAHIGLSNVNERLKLVFGNDYGLRICSEKNVFTSVTVRLPAMNIDDMKKLVKSSTSRENILD